LKLETSGDTESESFHSSFSFGEKAIASSGLKKFDSMFGSFKQLEEVVVI
jgi:hypothetical protein